jgi:hypothetical protein
MNLRIKESRENKKQVYLQKIDGIASKGSHYQNLNQNQQGSRKIRPHDDCDDDIHIKGCGHVHKGLQDDIIGE